LPVCICLTCPLVPLAALPCPFAIGCAFSRKPDRLGWRASLQWQAGLRIVPPWLHPVEFVKNEDATPMFFCLEEILQANLKRTQQDPLPFSTHRVSQKEIHTHPFFASNLQPPAALASALFSSIFPLPSSYLFIRPSSSFVLHPSSYLLQPPAA